MLEGLLQQSQFYEPPDWRHYPWQQEGIAFAVKYKRVLFPLPTGTGKTYMALKAAYQLGCKRYLVTCRGNSLYTWAKNFKLHRPDLKVAVIGKGLSQLARKSIYNDLTNDVIVVKMKTYLYDEALFIPLHFDIWIGDESHRYLRKHKTAQYEKVYALGARTHHIILLSGTPVSKGRQEYWPTLHMFRPKLFPGYWAFVSRYIVVVKGPFGVELCGPKNTELFREKVKTTIYRPSMPITGLPKVVRSTLPCELEDEVRDLYEKLWEEMLVDIGGNLVVSSTVLAKITRIRQLLLCPKILDTSLPYGIGMETIVDHMQEEEGREHCVWYTPYTDAIPFIQEYLALNGYHKTVVFRGGMDYTKIGEAEEYFRHEKDSVAICSISFSESFELETAKQGYFLSYDFDPYINQQAEGRMPRLTSEGDFVNAYYVHHLNTYDDRLLEINGDKVSNTKIDTSKVEEVKHLILQ